jgi:hypothetical protein
VIQHHGDRTRIINIQAFSKWKRSGKSPLADGRLTRSTPVGFEEEKYTILEVELPMLRIPVTPGRNLTTIIEVAARNHLLRMMGYDSTLEFEKKLLHRMEEGGAPQGDVEEAE